MENQPVVRPTDIISGVRPRALTSSVLERIPVGFIAIDKGGAVLVANSAARRLLYLPPDTITNLPGVLHDIIQKVKWPDDSPDYCVGFSFPLNKDNWCEAWITGVDPRSAGESYRWIVLRAVDEERRRCFESRTRLRQLSLVGEITTALNSTLGLEETFNVILVGATAGQGLGFNRAFLFLARGDDEGLAGRTAIGPASPMEAGKIWESLSSLGAGGLTEAVCTYRMVNDGDDAEVNRRVRETRIPRLGPDNPFAEIIRGAPAQVIHIEDSANPAVRAVFKSLDAHELACAPLRSRDKVVGLLLADHRITGNPITSESLRALELLAGQAGLAVERAGLADNLSRRVKELRQARGKIERIQGIITRLERYSVVGEITSEVAHQIRNPLTVIGGFARNLLSARQPDDPDYRGLSIIDKQTERVCKILDRIISVDGWEAQPRTTFELEPVLRQALEVMETRFADRRITWSLFAELDGFQIVGRSDAVRYAFFKILSALLQDLQPNTNVGLHAARADYGCRVVISPRLADKRNTGMMGPIAKIFQGDWGIGGTQRNLALTYLKEHGGALRLDKAEDHGPALVIEFGAVREDPDENCIDC